jgi:peptidoglycan-associated lipoprotein
LPPPDVPPGNPLPGGEPAIPQPGIDTFYNGMKMDRAALAANTVHFAYDSAVVKKSERSNMEAVAQALSADRSAKLLIEGNCDERGTQEYNRSLGDRRAGAARKELIKMGVSASRIMTKSYGKDQPADPGHDESAWSKNRRADFVLLRPGPGGNTTGGS